MFKILSAFGSKHPAWFAFAIAVLINVVIGLLLKIEFAYIWTQPTAIPILSPSLWLSMPGAMAYGMVMLVLELLGLPSAFHVRLRLG